MCTPGTSQVCFEGPQTSATKGICKAGVRTCLETGIWTPCLGQVLPLKEICDLQDNDCNGKIDEQDKDAKLNCTCTPGTKQACYAGHDGTLNVGTCKEGVQYCELSHKWGPCYAQITPTTEVCDRKDNDCNGKVDDGIDCRCNANDQRDCYFEASGNPGYGPCKAGKQRCLDGTWGPCEGAVGPSPEECDGVDNDCDGRIDGPRLNCASHLFCENGQCTCPGGLLNCQDKCIEKQSNITHCGQCGRSCQVGTICKDGNCQCPASQVDCQGTCVDLSMHHQHCGKCEQACKTGEYCEQSQCKQCPQGATTCGQSCCQTGQSCCGNLCVDIKQDPKHCGVCGTTCQVGQVCCDGKCVDPNADAQHCGACGNSCKQGESCCSGKCASTQSDPKHCGSCNAPCGTQEICCAGVCNAPQQNTQHCGACGITCKAMEQCCEGQCIDPKLNIKHCGACGTICKSDELCCDGYCHYKECPTARLFPAPQQVSIQKVLQDQKSPPNLYILGNFQGSFSTICNAIVSGNPPHNQTLTGRGSQGTFFVMKINTGNWQCQWLRAAGGTGLNVARDMALDALGNVYITGTISEKFYFYASTGTLYQEPSASRPNSAFIFQLNENGDQPVLYVAKSASPSHGYAISVERQNTAIGRAYITGQINAKTDFGSIPAPLIAGVTNAGFTAMLDIPAREFRWVGLQQNPVGQTIGQSVIYTTRPDNQNNTYVVTAGVQQPDPSKPPEIFLAQYEKLLGTAFGNVLRTPISAQQINGLSLSSDLNEDKLYLSGHGSVNLGTYQLKDSFLVRYQMQPTIVYQDIIQIGMLHMASRTLLVSPQGKIWVAGSVEEVSLGGVRQFGVAILQVDSANAQVSILHKAPSPTFASINSILLHKPDQLLVAGEFQKELQLAPPNTNISSSPNPFAGFLWFFTPRP